MEKHRIEVNRDTREITVKELIDKIILGFEETDSNRAEFEIKGQRGNKVFVLNFKVTQQVAYVAHS